MNIQHSILYCLILSCSILLISCGDDDIEGCTNSLADNFNSEATIDNGSCIISGCTNPAAENFNPNANNAQDADCIFPRDRFLGSYEGAINCELIEQFNGSTTMVLLEPVDSDVTMLTISLVTEEFTLPIDAVVEGNTLTMSLDNFALTIDFMGTMTPILLDVEGTATLSDDEQMITGNFTNIVLNPLTQAEILRDECTLSATRN